MKQRGLIKETEQPEGDFGAEACFNFICGDKGIVDPFYLSAPLVFSPYFKGEFLIDQKISFIRGFDRLLEPGGLMSMCV